MSNALRILRERFHQSARAAAVSAAPTVTVVESPAFREAVAHYARDLGIDLSPDAPERDLDLRPWAA